MADKVNATNALNELSAVAAARRIARRELTAEALTLACLERIEAREQVVGAWAFLDADLALAQARALDAGPLLGPLHGLPLGVKDLIDSADMPTAYGSTIYQGHRPAWDAACVAAARAAGAIVMGKTVTTEFATYQPGKTANPRHPGHTPGGSSSGSAAAVADCMVPLSCGTQTAGSVIRPAAYCGVVGFKPSFGRISRAGVKSLAESLDTVGVFARDVADAALLASVLSGRELVPPVTLAPPRIGLCRGYEWGQAQAEAQTAFERAGSMLAAAGAKVIEIELPPDYAGLAKAQAEIMAFEAAQALAYERHAHAGLLSAKLRELLAQGLALPVAVYDGHQALARRCRGELQDVFRDLDVLIAPSAPGEAPAGLAATGDPVFSRIWTLLRLPCVHLPCARGPGGLPLGVQAIGPFGADAKTLAVAEWMWQVLRTGV